MTNPITTKEITLLKQMLEGYVLASLRRISDSGDWCSMVSYMAPQTSGSVINPGDRVMKDDLWMDYTRLILKLDAAEAYAFGYLTYDGPTPEGMVGVLNAVAADRKGNRLGIRLHLGRDHTGNLRPEPVLLPDGQVARMKGIDLMDAPTRDMIILEGALNWFREQYTGSVAREDCNV